MSFSRGAMCVPLDDQENIICTLPLHIATKTVVAICGVMALVSPSKKKKRYMYDHWSVACTLIFHTCCTSRAEIALYRTQSLNGRTNSVLMS